MRLIWLAIALALALGLTLAPIVAESQQARKVWRIGVLAPKEGSALLVDVEGVRRGLKEFGYIEGKNLVIEARGSSRYEELGHAAVEVARLKPDVIVAIAAAAYQAKAATQTIPIVFASLSDPVAGGLVASISHPGGNVTGVTNLASLLTLKRLEFISELNPRVSRVAVLWYSGNPSHPSFLTSTQRAAERLHVTIPAVEVRTPDDLEKALAIVTEQHASGLLPLPDAMFNSHRASIIAFAAAKKLVLVASEESWVRDGALMWYGVDSRDHYRHAAAYVDRILKGTKPADLPVEEPTTFRLVINQRTATTLGLIIPPTLRIRADQVIQ